jgi:glycosyltransferase involved in cell wall biosynthesis
VNQNGTVSWKRFFSSIVRLPDDKQGWIINIVVNGYRIMRRHKIDTFITSGPPMSTHVGGLLLKSITQAKWIADFRDPWWTGNHWKKGFYYHTLTDSLQKRLESKVIKRADRVVLTTVSLTQCFKRILREVREDKFLTITNGFDEDDFLGMRNRFSINEHKIIISHAGTLYLNRDPEPFFKVLSNLIKEGEIGKQDIEVHLIGDYSYYKGASIEELINHYDLSPTVQLLGIMPFGKTLKRLMNSDALLLLAQGQPDQIPGKVFEYLKINKPIFAITEEGETKRILEEFKNAFITDSSEKNEMAEKFLEMLKAIKSGRKYLGSDKKIGKYDRRYLTEKLARCLEEVHKNNYT